MADTTARTLELLSLLQRRRHWTGRELADRLDVTERTVRRDVSRLRSLGYEVTAVPGADGGYQLEGGSGAVPLLLTDDEGAALAIGLHVLAHGTSELAEASVGALGKVLASLPPVPRRRVETIASTTATGPSGGAVMPSLADLAEVADACRDGVRLSFAYRAADGTATDRYVEPYRVVALWGRWYLVAFDPDRDDWRTFRVDRIHQPKAARNTFTRRKLPAQDLHRWLEDHLSAIERPLTVVVDIDVSAAEIRRRFGRRVHVAELGPQRCRATMAVDSFDWPTHLLAAVDATFVVRSPAALADHLRAVALRFQAARGETLPAF